jgi:nitrite reductase (NAD(P)H)
MVVEQVKALGLDVLLSKRVGYIETTDDNKVKGVVFENGKRMDCACICFAVRVLPLGRQPRPEC